MNGTDTKYTSEYVELKTSLERIKTKLESMDFNLRQVQQTLSDVHKQMDRNRSDIAGIKAVSAIIGGLTGSIVAVLLRFVLSGGA